MSPHPLPSRLSFLNEYAGQVLKDVSKEKTTLMKFAIFCYRNKRSAALDSR